MGCTVCSGISTNMQNSIFNQIDVQEAYERGDMFFKEYLMFHKEDEKQKKQPTPKKIIEKYEFDEFDFDAAY